MEAAKTARLKKRREWWSSHKKLLKSKGNSSGPTTGANSIPITKHRLGKTEEELENNSENEAQHSQEKIGNKIECAELEKPVGPNHPKKVSGYVIFVGNLPYSATKEDINNHFSKAGEVKAVRLLTDKKTDRPRGFAYVEFLNSEAYQEAFKLHHSKLLGRSINVEFTAPGSRKSERRKHVIKRKSNILKKFFWKDKQKKKKQQ